MKDSYKMSYHLKYKGAGGTLSRQCRFWGMCAFLFALGGCATTTFTPSIKSLGEYRDMSSIAGAANDLPRGSADNVRLLIGKLPDGVTMDRDVMKVDEAKYEVLGRVNADLNNPLAANLGMWVYDYAPGERWRVGYCAWQVPLSWLTFSLWAWISPLHYPCKALMGSDEERTAQIVETLKRAGKALGADLVIVSDIGGTTIISGTQNSAVVSSIGATQASGFALRSKRAASADVKASN
jgi:hypothetical protein